MFHESDEYAEILFQYFNTLGRKYSDSLNTIEKNIVEDLLRLWEKNFYHKNLLEFRNNFINYWRLIIAIKPYKKISEKIEFFISIMHVKLDASLIKHMQIKDIKIAVILAILFNDENGFKNLLSYAPNIALDQSVIDVLLCEGNLQLYQIFKKYCPLNNIKACLNQRKYFHDLENISDLALLKHLVETFDGKDKLSDLSLITATTKQNYPLLIYLLRDLKVHTQESHGWSPSAFDHALDNRDKISLQLLVKSGAFDLTIEIYNFLKIILDVKNNKYQSDESNFDKKLRAYYKFILKNNIDFLITTFSDDRIELNRLRKKIMQMVNDKEISTKAKIYLTSILNKLTPPSLQQLCINFFASQPPAKQSAITNELNTLITEAAFIGILNTQENLAKDCHAGRLFHKPKKRSDQHPEQLSIPEPKKHFCTML